LLTFRQSGTVEAVRGGAEGPPIASKMANSFDESKFLQATYAPVDRAAVRAESGKGVGSEQKLESFPTFAESTIWSERPPLRSALKK
jgi:hypothetical protein